MDDDLHTFIRHTTMQEDTLTPSSTLQRSILVIWKAYLETVLNEPFPATGPYEKSRWWKEKSMS